MIRQNFPDFCFRPFSIKKEDKKNLNPRYAYFRQNYYTAGDDDQFLENWKVCAKKDKNIVPNRTFDMSKLSFCGYKDYCLHDVFNTYSYLQKFKKSCFLQFYKNELITFLPFSKQDFKNEWSQNVKIDPKFETIYEMMKYLSQFDPSFPYDEKRIHKDFSAWYGNNGLVRFEYPLSENDNGYNMLKDMFVCLKNERKLPELVEFFLNKRDYPLLTFDKTEPYDAFFGKDCKLVSKSFDKYCPILSMCTTDKHADIPIPTWDDWSRVAYQTEGKLFSKDFQTFSSPEEFMQTKWEEKKPVIVFRGSSTGRGTTVKNNIRLFFSQLSASKPVDANGNLLMDCGITKWNLRPRKLDFDSPLTTIYLDELNLSLVEYMSPLEQSKYKYILHLPGHTCAYRLSLEMSYGSVIFVFPSEEKLWFFDWLVPFEHYIPLKKEFTETDLFEKLEWCKKNDEKCKKIAENAKKFADQYLSRKGILDYLQFVFTAIFDNSKKCVYKTHSLHQYQVEKICSSLNQTFSFLNSDVSLEMIHYFLSDKMDDFTKTKLQNMPLFLTEVFHHLHKNNKLVSFVDQQKEPIEIFNGKKNSFTLFCWKGKKYLQKEIFPSWKDDALHQFFVGHVFINSLAESIPNFLKTYYLYHNDDKCKKLIIDYHEGETLDICIKKPSFTLTNLTQIWISICCALQQAQQHCAFIHMDLYPWNILIQEGNFDCCYHFVGNGEHLSVSLNTNILPIMIDYGNSHVSKEGFHYYTTTPFYLNRFHDIFCLVVTSLDLFLKNHKINGSEIRFIIKIMKYFSSLEELTNISQIRNFLKQQKKFSTMISTNRSELKDKTPYDFLNYLVKNNLSFQNKVQIFSKKKNNIKKHLNFQFHHSPAFYNFLENIQFVENCIGDELILQEDLYIWFRRNWLRFFSFIQKKKIRSKLEEIASYIILQKFKSVIEKLEKKYKKRVWSNYLFSDFGGDWLKFTEKDCEKWVDDTVFPDCKKISAKVPFLKTHNCLHCMEKDKTSKYFDDSFFENVAIASIFNDFSTEGMDLYDFHIQNHGNMMKYSS